jgi:nicotianamine synthase
MREIPSRHGHLQRPGAMRPAAAEAAQRIHAIYWQLALIERLDADPNTLPLAQELLQLLSFRHFGEDMEALLADPVMRAISSNMRRIFAKGSYLYELQAANKLLAKSDLQTALTHEYPFFQQYWRASAMEFQVASSFLDEPPQRVLLAGSGPLPLTSIVMTQRFGIHVHNIDIEPRANELACRIAERLGLSQQLSFATADIAECDDLAAFDIVWLAALAGGDRDKRRILRHLAQRMRPGAVLAVRTASQLRTFLYPPVALDDFENFDLKVGVQPYTDNYHSVLIAQRPRA